MPESAKDEIARRIAEYPEDARDFFKRGITAASKLSDQDRKLVLQKVIDRFGSSRTFALGSVLQLTEALSLRALEALSPRELDQVGYVYSLVIGLVLESHVTVLDFVEATRDQLFAPDQEATFRSIVDSICTSREEIRANVDQAQLAGAVLPSLETLNIAVDIRIRVSDGAVKTSVPVALLHLGTDSRQEVWVQLTKGEVQDTINQLSRCLEKLNLAETWVGRKG